MTRLLMIVALLAGCVRAYSQTWTEVKAVEWIGRDDDGNIQFLELRGRYRQQGEFVRFLGNEVRLVQCGERGCSGQTLTSLEVERRAPEPREDPAPQQPERPRRRDATPTF
ncbi:MAG: hypothetical protein AAGE52_01255 [Myxococcota bacterium]